MPLVEVDAYGERLRGCIGCNRWQVIALGQRGEAVLLEDVAAAEVAIVVKVIVDRGVDGGEFLQGLDVPEFRHCPFPSSERLV